MSDKIEIILWVSTNKVGSTCERKIKVDKEDWESMNDSEREEYMLDELHNTSMYEWGYRNA